jgi:NADH:ubiquinone oxidoreductase subunit D
MVDIIVSADSDVGYDHQGEEKMSEHRTFVQNVPHVERPVIMTQVTFYTTIVLQLKN